MLEDTVQAERDTVQDRRHYPIEYVRGVHTRFLREYGPVMKRHGKRNYVGVCHCWDLGWHSDTGFYIFLVTDMDREELYGDIPRIYRGVLIHIFQMGRREE